MSARLTIITIALYGVLAIGIFFTTKLLRPNVVLANVYPRELTTNDVMHYTDSTENAQNSLWQFGYNNNYSVKRKGNYKYPKEGTYLVKLIINDKLADTFSVIVKNPKISNFKDTAITIYAGDKGVVGESVHFKILGSNVEYCEWYFGESGKMDSREQEAYYTFNQPKKYLVKLITNLNPKVPILHEITISPSYKSTLIASTDNKPSTGGVGTGSGGQIKDYMQKIANGGDFQSNYDLIRKCLCKGNPVIIVNGKKIDYIYSYLQNLKITGGLIKNVTTESDSITHCVKKLTVLSQKK